MELNDYTYVSESLSPYPLEKLKRVEKPTNKHVGKIERRDQREHALALAFRGDYGEIVKHLAPGLTVKEPLGAALADIQDHINQVPLNSVAPDKAPIPDDPKDISRHIKSFGYFLGADMMGICKLPESAVYTHDMEGNPIEVSYEYAIVLICRKSLRTINASSGYDWIFDPVSLQTYQRLACQSEVIANYIRRLGFEAEASNANKYLTLMPQLALEAGLGEVSRMGIVLNPFIGANFKIAAVLTNLPLAIDRPIDFGLQEYCRNCKICAEQCPSRSISSGDKVVYNGYETWKMNERSCAEFAIKNRNGNICGRCTKICPWNREDVSPEHYASWDGDMNKIIKEVDEQAQKLRARNFSNTQESVKDKWWLDLVMENGRLVIPPAPKK